MKHLKTIFACLLMTVLSIGQVWAETVEFTPSNCTNWTSSSANQSQTIDGITISSTAAANNTQLRLYSGGTHTFTSTVGNITKIEFTCTASGTNSNGPGKMSLASGSAGSYSYSGTLGTWTGDAATCALYNGQSRCTKIVVTYTPSGSGSGKENLTDEQLSWSAASANITFGDEPYSLPSLTNSIPVSVTYESTAEAVATISNVGVVSVLKAGSTTIKAVFAGNDDYNAKTVSYTLTVAPAPLIPIAGGIIDEIKISDLLTSGSGYQPFSDKQASNEGHSDAVYAGKVCISSTNIQMNTIGTNASAGRSIVTTTSGGNAKRVQAFWGGSNTADRKLTVYGSNTAYAGTETAASGTKLGDLTYASGDSYAYIDITGDYAYLQIVASGAIYMSQINITWVAPDVSKVATPQISGTANFYPSTSVSITCGTENAAIYYTTNGTTPTSASTPYEGAFTVNADGTTTVKAIAVKDGMTDSDVAEQTFTKATILTVAEALTIIEGLDNKTATTAEYYVSGVVSTVTALTVDGTGEYYISADGTKTSELQVYKGKWVGGANFTSTDQLIEGDDVTIKGKLKKYNSYKELDQNNEVVAYKLKARLAWSEESYEADLSSSNTFPSLTNTNGVSVSYSSTNTDAATINPSTGAISLVAVGSTTIKATFTGNETYKANEVSYTLNVSNSVLRADISFEENGGSTVTDLTEQSNLPDPLPTITKAGYNFGGWWTTSDFQDGTEAVAGAAVESTDDIVLYAKWLDPYTVTEALTMIDALADNGETGNVYVSGIVCTAPSNLISGEYLTYYISVDGTETNRLQVYKGKNVGNIAFTDKEDVQAADQVVVFGPLKKFKQGDNIIPEFNTGNYLYSLSRKAEAGIEWGVASFDAYIGESNTFPTLTNPNSLTVAYSSSNETAATIDPATGAITLGTTPNVNTTITASFAGNSSYKAAEVSYTLNVYNPTNPGTITYEENGGSIVTDVTTPVDNFPDPLPEPTKENYIFAGWWTTSTFNDGTQAVAGAPMDGNVILYAKWTEIPVWAYTYTSNLELKGNSGTKSYAEKVKITVNEVLTEFDALRACTGSAAGSCIVKVPAGTQTLHFHAAAWNAKTSTITVTMGETELLVQALDADAGIKSSSPYTLEGIPYEYYYSIDLSSYSLAEETTITFSAGSDKRFVLFGVNQEGGVLPVLESIEIKGDLTTKTGYKAGDALDLDGLTVEATYSLGGVAQSPVDITSDPELELTYDPLVEDQTEVTITASYKGQTDDITITGLDPVASADPKIYVSTLNVNFASVEVGDAVPAAQTITVNLTNIASVTATLGGTNPEAFSISKTEGVVDGDEITISLLANTDAAASYAATLTISDGEGGADDKTVNLSFAVTEPVVEDDVTGTWTLVTNATTLAAGKKVIIAQYVEADGAINTMAGQASNNRSVIASTVAGTTLTPAVGTKVMTLADAGEGNFYLKTSDGEYLYNASTSSKSYLRTKAEEENVSWTIAVDAEGVATITSVENTNRTQMRYNPNTSGSPLFNCYASGQEDIALYMLEEDTPEPEYETVRSGLEINRYYTVCLPKKVTAIKGATFWTLQHKSADGATAYLEEETNNLPFAAGKPFIIQATAANLDVVYEGDATDVAGTNGALHGTLVYMDAAALATAATNEGSTIYMLLNNVLRPVGENNHLDAKRAYVVLNDLTVAQPQSAPGKRVRAMPMQPQVVTDIDAINASEKPMKMMINGQLFILRGEKMYDATGRLVK